MTVVVPETVSVQKKRKIIKAKLQVRNGIWALYGGCLFLVTQVSNVCFLPSASRVAENGSTIFRPLDQFPTCPDMNLGMFSWHRANSKLIHGQYFVLVSTGIVATATQTIVPSMSDNAKTQRIQAHVWRFCCITCIVNGILELWYCKKGLNYMYGTTFVLGENTRIDLDEYDDAYIPSLLFAGLTYFGIAIIYILEIYFQKFLVTAFEDENIEAGLKKDPAATTHRAKDKVEKVEEVDD